MKGRLHTSETLLNHTEIQADVCIVGSGAGGAVLAARLTDQGHRVVMLEEGSYHTRATFELVESKAFPNLYQDQGGRKTEDLAISILQGRSVGGGTTVNWTTCFRTPERILAHWESEYGAEGLDFGALAPHFSKVEERLNIQQWPAALVNANNDVLRRGCEALGWQFDHLHRNVNGCANSGYCGFGCPVDGKQAMHVTYIPDALHAGLILCTNTRAMRLNTENGRVNSLDAVVLHPDRNRPNGATVTVKAKVFVSSAGAINSPALLLRSEINPNGRVGKRTLLHPVCSIPGKYPNPIDPWYGAPQSVASHEFVDRGPDKVGFFLEVPPSHPMLAATAARGFGEDHYEQMKLSRFVSPIIAICVDGLTPGAPGGEVGIHPDGRPRVSYTFTPALQEAFLAAHHAMAKLHFAAGCEMAYTFHEEPLRLKSLSDAAGLDDMPYGNLDLSIFSAHQMGGCNLGKSAENSVVNSKLQHHHIPNLFIVDGSVFPTALGVNPSLTIYGLASLASEYVGSAV